MIPNIATLSPPETLDICDTEYPINWHYVTWIQVIDLLDELDFEALEEDADIIEEIELLVFGCVIRENAYNVLAAVTEFAAGYPRPKNERATAESTSRRIVDFGIDLNSILIAIRDQSGYDLTQSDELFHWWRFLVEFENLKADHHISRIMELRAYDGDDRERKKLRDMVALPPKITRRERRLDQEMADLFYNC